MPLPDAPLEIVNSFNNFKFKKIKNDQEHILEKHFRLGEELYNKFLNFEKRKEQYDVIYNIKKLFNWAEFEFAEVKIELAFDSF